MTGEKWESLDPLVRSRLLLAPLFMRKRDLAELRPALAKLAAAGAADKCVLGDETRLDSACCQQDEACMRSLLGLAPSSPAHVCACQCCLCSPSLLCPLLHPGTSGCAPWHSLWATTTADCTTTACWR